MDKLSEFITKKSKLILILSLILLGFSFIGMKLTKINYDILVYLPDDIETIKGQNILTDDFSMGSYSIAVIENASPKEILNIEEKIKKVDGVNEVASIYDVFGTNIPLEILPEDVLEKVHSDNTDLLIVTFKDSTSNENTINAVEEIRNLTNDKYKFGGMSSMVLDTMNLSEKEIAIYVTIAVILCLIVLELSLDSYLVPVLLLLNIGMAIVYNLGTNIFLGKISYITKALVAVLQLGVTTDFSIFLYHAYEKNKKTDSKEIAMKKAIKETFVSVIGSSTTTIAGFLVLCTMSLTLGKDLGIVMAKGVALGVITVLTVFPALLLFFDKQIARTSHKVLTPKFDKINKQIVKHHKLIFIIFLILLVPAYLANSKVEVYYKIDKTLPETLESITANTILKEKYNIVSPEMIITSKDLKTNDIKNMVSEIKQIDGIDFVLSKSDFDDLGISSNMLPSEISSLFESENYQMFLVNSTYEVASDELNEQVVKVNDIVKKYDKNGIVAGEGPLMKDLINISDTDFNNVNTSSIVCIFVILFIVLKSFSLPFLLILAIEFAICANMGISYFSGKVLPFVAPIVLGTIQLGATIDYAILMTTTYLEKRKTQKKEDAVLATLNQCGSSVFVSGLCFFAATFGVGVYSQLEMVGSLCTLISRGALLSMLIVITVLPSILLIFDKIIQKTNIGKEKIMKNKKLALCSLIALSIPLNIFALTKNETVYNKLYPDGTIKTSFVNEELLNTSNLKEINDVTTLEDIINLSGNEAFTKTNDKLTWNASGNNIFYQGKTTKKEPVSFKVTYKLDGQDILLKDLLGKSGKVEIKIEYTNNSKKSVKINNNYETMYTPFVMLTSISLNNDCKNISITNGKIINNGTGNVAFAIASPNLSDSLNINSLNTLNKTVITYDTTKFELGTIYSVITPKLLNSSDLSKLNNITGVNSKLAELTENVNKIENGSTDLKDGSIKLNTNVKKLSDALTSLDENVTALKNGSGDIDSGVDQVIENINNIKLLLPDNTESITKMNDLIAANNNTINNLSALNSTIKEKYDSANLKELSYELILGNDSLDNNTKITLINLKSEYENHYDSNNQLIGLLKLNVSALESNIKELESLSAKVTQMLPKMEAGISKLKTGTTSLSTNMAKLNVATNELSIKGKALVIGTTNLEEGLKTLNEGITMLNNEAIKPITNKITNELIPMTTRVKELTKLGENYTSFAGSNVTGETKFIYVIDGEKVKEEKNSTEEKTEKDNLWTRIKNLFK